MMIRKMRPLFLFVTLICLGTPCRSAEESLNLAGKWKVYLDRGNDFNPTQTDHTVDFASVVLPGALRDSALGDHVGPDTNWIAQGKPDVWKLPKYDLYRQQTNFKIPFWLQPERHFVGTAWYERNITIPTHWKDQGVTLFLERPHWRSSVYLDGSLVGCGESLSTHHEFDLSDVATPGEHRLLIGINNNVDTIDVGHNAHSVSDHTQTAWNGIVGEISLLAHPNRDSVDVEVHPELSGDALRVRLNYLNRAENEVGGLVDLSVVQNGEKIGSLNGRVRFAMGSTSHDFLVSVNDTVKLWDEFHPNLCKLEVVISSFDPKLAKAVEPIRREISFGFRTLDSQRMAAVSLPGGRHVNQQIRLNDRPIFLRGTLECCVFPLTGYPPTDVDSWRRIVRICKSHGLNHIRFHSWCPPKAAFVAADELGFYYQVECSSWPNQSTTLGEGKPVDDWLYREADRILAAYGNHPSFLMLAAGNEPGGPGSGASYLRTWVNHFKSKDKRMLFTGGSGWPSISENQFQINSDPRIQQWGAGLNSRINAKPPETRTDYETIVGKYAVPLIGHEIGQWCVFPNFDETTKYTGSLKARNFEIFRDLLDRAGLMKEAHEFLMASGKLQTLVYKESIESSLRTKNLGGFQLLDLRDFPGQGTALVGMVDPFWDSKPYVSSKEIARFCGPTVPLARMDKRVFTSNESFEADIEVAHYGAESFIDAVPRWLLKNDEVVVAQGKLSKQRIETGGLRKLGRLQVPLNAITKAAKLKLIVDVGGHENDWDFWVYPSISAALITNDVLVSQELTSEVIESLDNGRTVLLCPENRRIETDVVLGFSPIFWNTVWTNGQSPHTLGIHCDPSHPAFTEFPTEFHSNWQWWDLIHRACTMELDHFPIALRPIIGVVPDWHSPKRLGLLFEAKVGRGKLLVSSIDLQSHQLEMSPVSRQLHASLMQYLESEYFEPQIELTIENLKSLFRERNLIEKVDAVVTVDSAQRGFGAEKAFDGNLETMWHTPWGTARTNHPHHITIDLKSPNDFSEVHVWPRVDSLNGVISEYRVLISENGEEWREIAAGKWERAHSKKVIKFNSKQRARFLRLVADSELVGGALTSIAEIEVW